MENKETGLFRNLYLVSIAIVALMLIMSAYVWSQITGGRQQFLPIFAVPILIAVILCLLALFTRIETRKLHISQSQKALATFWVTLLLYFVIIHTVLLLNSLGQEPSISTYWPILTGLVTTVIGNYLGKIRSNSMAGIRTPWTLSSELSWNKTHRLGGRLLFLLGLIQIAGSLVMRGDFWVYFLLSASVLWTVFLVFYSYIIWKRDPDRSHSKPSYTA